jgi:hypothetical protein
MPARKWTPEQKARQGELIHKWKPWEQSTGAKTPEGKAISKMNAVNYSLREVLRESARNNRQLLVYIRAVFAELDTSQCPPPDWDEARERMDVLLSNAKQAMEQR